MMTESQMTRELCKYTCTKPGLNDAALQNDHCRVVKLFLVFYFTRNHVYNVFKMFYAKTFAKMYWDVVVCKIEHLQKCISRRRPSS